MQAEPPGGRIRHGEEAAPNWRVGDVVSELLKTCHGNVIEFQAF